MTISSVSYAVVEDAELDEEDAERRVARSASEDSAIVITFDAFDWMR
jgi:hypothetical protein